MSIAGFLLLVNFNKYDDSNRIYKKIPILISILIGSVIGFISGIVGIGCGIFLRPILLILNIDKAKNIITGASIFILLNSLSGIMGQITKNNIISELLNFWPLFLMVIIGGQLGNFLNLKILSSKILTLITSALVLFVSLGSVFKLGITSTGLFLLKNFLK